MSAAERMMMVVSDGQMGRNGVTEMKGDRVGKRGCEEVWGWMWWKVDREKGLTRLI